MLALQNAAELETLQLVLVVVRLPLRRRRRPVAVADKEADWWRGHCLQRADACRDSLVAPSCSTASRYNRWTKTGMGKKGYFSL